MSTHPHQVSPEQNTRLMSYAQTLDLINMPIDALLKVQAEAFQQAAAKEKMFSNPTILQDSRETADGLLAYSVLAITALFYALVLWHRNVPEHEERWSEAHRLVTGQRAYDDQDLDPYHRRNLAEWMSRLEFYVSRWSSGANMEPEELYPVLATQVRRAAIIYGVEYAPYLLP